MAGRTGVRATLSAFIANPPIETLNQVFTSFPKRLNFQVNSQPGQMNRLAIGGATNGWKRVDYTVILQVYAHSLHPNSEDVMQDFDTLIDNIKTRLRSNHNFGDETGTLVWQGAEPVIMGRYGEPATNQEGATDIFAELEFDVTEMVQA